MKRLYYILLIFLLQFSWGYSQLDEIWLEADPNNFGDSSQATFYTQQQVEYYLQSIHHKPDEFLIGGYISSIFHESVDSVKIVLWVDDHITDSVFSDNGVFYFILKDIGSIIDLSIAHPDFHPVDTTILFPESGTTTLVYVDMQPKYKILLRGRVYAGNMPLEGVKVTITHIDEVYRLSTLGCYYDKEDYWNCLFDGMFKINLSAENPLDSIYIQLSKEGMKTYNTGMTINEYSGGIMDFKMKYENTLPVVPLNNLNFKLSLPILSFKDDWYVGLSYYHLLNASRLRRIALGIDANMYITNVSVTHNTFSGLEPSVVDSTYISAFAGPSLMVWLISPEIRKFSTYAGCTFAYNFSKPALVFQPYAGSRIFLDMNKAVSFEIRYCEYLTDVVQYVFNPYGSAFSYDVERTFQKIHVNLGIQITF